MPVTAELYEHPKMEVTESGKNIFINFSIIIIKDYFSLVFVLSDVLLCIELIYTVTLSSNNHDPKKSIVLKNAEMRVTVNKDIRN
jgi:hypothetical protein